MLFDLILLDFNAVLSRSAAPLLKAPYNHILREVG